MCEPFDLFAEAIAVQCLDCGDNPRMERPTPLLQQTAVRDLMRERMLEGVFEIREQPRLVEELGSLQAIEPAPKRVVRQLGNGLEQRERDIFANDTADLEKVFVIS